MPQLRREINRGACLEQECSLPACIPFA